MLLNVQSPAKILPPAYRAQSLSRAQVERFKAAFVRLQQQLAEAVGESEEHLKNLVAVFLREVWYVNTNYINTRERQDLAIHLGASIKDAVGVIIEVKKPSNRAEMSTAERPNVKALHELLRYYLQERQVGENREIKRLVITNTDDWYIFDAADFERHIYSNAKLLKSFSDWSEGRLGAANTDWFYREIAAPFFEKELPALDCCHFQLSAFQKTVLNADTADDVALLDLYKVFSPEFLLKKPFANDSNALNRKFYDELLYILGLEETKEGSKKIIRRADKTRREGSLLENALNKLLVSGKWRKAPDLDSFGDTEAEKQFSIALELGITWLNRILFLKLLEGQLKRWQPGDTLSTFLSPEFIKDYDDLSQLFFEVLNCPVEQRRESIRQRYGSLPYLNSSLFELSALEDAIFSLEVLDDRAEMPLSSNTVLRDAAGKRLTGKMSTLHYLFAFLDAYDFSSESGANIQEDNKDIINAAVLGLIFEKINGYRDGSFYTPGFITMYMCRETLRRAVLQKFNTAYEWDCQNLETDLYNRLDTSKTGDYNELINSLHICDPAVGSGHFLVSALNELIAIKSDLGLLCDRQGRRLRDLRAVVGVDELLLIDNETDLPYQYRPGNTHSQRIQEAIFHEKQTLIENCLFGVDINPKSVMICRLRLWIELLKHAYYTEQKQLETLPNIDINIKTGNSLISRFALDEDLSEVFRKQRFNRQVYLSAVEAYKQSRDKAGREELRVLIEGIKNELRQSVFNRNPFAKTLSQKRGQLVLLDNNIDLFGEAKKDAATVSKERQKLQSDIADLERQLEEYKTGPLYRNSFEWRFEFPEVLDDAGNFVGFDVVVGNPPYIRQEGLATQKPFLQNHYRTYAGTADLYVFFVERAMNVLCSGGQFSYILPNKWMKAGYGDKLRQFVKQQRIMAISDFGDLPVFEEATTYPCIFEMVKAEPNSTFKVSQISSLNYESGLTEHIKTNQFDVKISSLQDTGWTLTSNTIQQLLDKLNEKGKPLGEHVDGKIYYGIKTGLNEAFVIDSSTRQKLIEKNSNSAEIIKPFLAGRDIKKYHMPEIKQYVIFIPWHFPLHNDSRVRGASLDAEREFESRYPAVYEHLFTFKKQLEARNQAETGIRYEWYALQRWAAEYHQEFEKPKIVYQVFQVKPCFAYDEGGCLCNNSIWIIPNGSKNLCAFLNSKVGWFLISNFCTAIQNGYQLIFQYFGKIPVPNTIENNEELTSLVTQILDLKRTDPTTDTTALETEIDQLVYALYGLTEEEIKIVEGK